MNLFIKSLLVFSCLISSLAYSNTDHIGIIIKSSGDTFVIRNDEERITLKRRDKIFEGDHIVTEFKSTLQIRFIDKAMLAIRENSELVIEEYHAQQDETEEKVLMELLSGGFRTITGNFGKASEDGYEVKTPAASIGIRGTDYEAILGSDNSLSLGVWSGGISVENDSGSIDLGADTGFSFGTVKKDSAPKGSLTPPDDLNQKVEKTEEKEEEEEETESEEESESDKKSEEDESEEESDEKSEDGESEESEEKSEENSEEASESDQSEESEESSEDTSNEQSNDDSNNANDSNQEESTTQNDDSSNSQTESTAQSQTDNSNSATTENTTAPDPSASIGVITVISPEENLIEDVITEIVEEQITNPGNSRLTGEQIDQISDDPNVGLIFFSEDDRIEIYAPTLESNVEAQMQDFSQGTKPAQIVSSQSWPLINVESGDYVNESLSISVYDLNAYIYLDATSSEDLLVIMQQQIDSQIGEGVLTVYVDQTGHFVIEALESAQLDSFTIDTSQASTFAQDSGLVNTTVTSENFDNQLTFNLLVEIDGLSSSFPITLDKNHSSIDQLVADIQEELPSNSNIIVRPSDNGIEFIAMTTSEQSSIRITDVEGDALATSRLKDALGGITEGQVSAQANSGDDQSFHFGYMLKNSDGSVTFITYPDEAIDVLDGEYIEPEYILNGGNISNLRKVENVGGNDNINWGYWDNNDNDPATLDSSETSENGAQVQSFNQKYYFIDATPAQTGQLIGQKSFSTNSEFLGASDSGDITNITGQMQVDFSNAQLTGDLNIEVGSNENWQLDYSGQVEGATVQMDHVWGEANLSDGSSSDASGNMGGIFVDPGSIYVGGFQIQTLDDAEHTVDGVYMMEEDQ